MKTYGMFSESGNSAVGKIVECAETAELPWFVVQKMLEALAEFQPYGEATDTAVREAVYTTLFISQELQKVIENLKEYMEE